MSSSSIATTTLHVAHPPSSLVAPSNICSRSRQRDNITAPAIIARCRRTSNVHPCEERHRSASASAPPPRLATRPPQPSLLKPDAAALLPTAPATPRPPTAVCHRPYAPTIPLALLPSSRWHRRPRRAGVVVVRRSPSLHWRSSRWRHPRLRSSGEQVLFSPVCLVKKY